MVAYQKHNTSLLNPFIATMNSTMIKADVILGRPKNDCMYYGICKIEPLGTLAPHDNNTMICTATALFSFNAIGTLVVLFDKESLSKRTNRIHFKGKHFKILESIELPRFITSFLGQEFFIKEGRYEIQEDHYFYTIEFS